MLLLVYIGESELNPTSWSGIVHDLLLVGNTFEFGAGSESALGLVLVHYGGR